MELKGAAAVVTGGSRGMGQAIALELARAGMNVALVGRDPERLAASAAAVEAAGGSALPVTCDIRFGNQTEALAAQVLDRFGRIDLLVNSAFWGPPASIEETTEEFWDLTLDTTLKGAFLCARAVVPAMKRQGGGRIVNIGSLAGKIGEDARTAYCAAKWGLEGLSAALTEELHKHNIRVHLISPAATDTPWWREVGATLTPQTLERMIPPETIAAAVLWVLRQPDAVHVPDVPIYNFRNPFEGRKSPFESQK